MNLNKKQFLGIAALVILFATSSVVFAVLYMTKSVTITGGVSVVGAIEVYDEDGETALTGFNFDNFTGGTSETKFKVFFINNTGNQPVHVYWNMSSSSITWEKTPDLVFSYYLHRESSLGKYHFGIYNATNDYLYPDTESYYLDVDEGAQFRFRLHYTGLVNTAETFDLTTSFYAEDA